jgi:hypothetical protein
MLFGLSKIISSITSTFRFYDAPEGVSGSAIADIPSDAAPVDSQPASEPDIKIEAPEDLSEYRGSVEVNPEQRPLRKMDLSGYTKEDIDELLSDPDSKDLLMSDEEIAALKAKAEEENPEEKKDEKAEGKPEAGDKKETKADAHNEVDESVKSFLNSIGLQKEEYDQIPDALKDKLVENFIKSVEGKEGAPAEEPEEIKVLKESYETLQKDPIVAARIKELQTGHNYVARDLAPVSNTELQQIDSALNEGNATKAAQLINNMIRTRAKVAVDLERSVYTENEVRQKLEQEAIGTLYKLGEIDKRLALEEKDFRNIDPKHKEYDKFQNGLGKVVSFIRQKGLTLNLIKELGPDMLYTMYSKESGWDKERDKTIAKVTKENLLKALKSPKVAQELKPIATGSAKPNSRGLGGYNRTDLVKELAAGKAENFIRLQKQAEDDPKMVNILSAIQADALAIMRKSNPVT